MKAEESALAHQRDASQNGPEGEAQQRRHRVGGDKRKSESTRAGGRKNARETTEYEARYERGGTIKARAMR